MQLLFDSYPYESQRRITRLLLGLNSDVLPSQLGEEEAKDEEAVEDFWYRRPEKR